MALAIGIEDLLYKQKIAPYYMPRMSVDIDKKDDSLKAPKRSSLESSLKSSLESSQNSSLNTSLNSSLKIKYRSSLKVVELMHKTPQITIVDIAKETGYSVRWVAAIVKRLQNLYIIRRVGSDKYGHWEVSIF